MSISIEVEELDGSKTIVDWKTRIYPRVTDTSQPFQLDRFHPRATYNGMCHLKCSKSPASVYGIQLSLTWECKPASGETSSSEILANSPDHRPCAIWATLIHFNCGQSLECKLKENKTTDSTLRWKSSQFEFKLVNKNEEHQNGTILAFCCVKFLIQFETCSRGEKNTLKHLAILFTQQINCDVQFCFEGGEQIGGHESILGARSQVFAAMFKHDMKKSETRQVNIQDIQPNIFKELLHYIYSGQVATRLTEITAAQFLHLVADKYDIEDLKEECYRFLRSSIEVNNVLQLLAWAHVNSVDDLKEAALDFTALHGKEICHLKEFVQLIENHRELSVACESARRHWWNLPLDTRFVDVVAVLFCTITPHSIMEDLRYLKKCLTSITSEFVEQKLQFQLFPVFATRR